MWRFLVCVVGAGALSACSFDFKGFGQADAGGAGGTGASAVGPATTASGITSSGITSSNVSTGSGAVTSSSTVVGSTSASSASSSSGAGGGGPLNPCGGFTDDLSTFPTAMWMINGMASEDAGKAKLLVTPAQTWAGAWANASGIDECALTIDLGSPPSSGSMYLKIDDVANQAKIDYTDSSAHMLSLPNGQNSNLNAKPDALGFALTGGNIYYLYRSGATWNVLGHDTRPVWMNGPEALGFGVEGASNGKNGTFSNFNLSPITKADLGL